MPNTNLLDKLADAADRAAAKADEASGLFDSVRQTIEGVFGPNGMIAAYIVVGVILLLLVAKLARITFSTLKYVVVPAIVLAFIATIFFDVPIEASVPASATVCSLILLFKG